MTTPQAMKHAGSFLTPVLVVAVMVVHVTTGAQWAGNLAWFWCVVIGVAALISAVAVPLDRFATTLPRRPGWQRVSMVAMHAAVAILAVATGWFFAGALYASGWAIVFGLQKLADKQAATRNETIVAAD